MGNFRRCAPIAGVDVSLTRVVLSQNRQNFTTYVKTDLGGRFDVTASKIVVDGLRRDEDAHIYDDQGVAHFGATFEHTLKLTPQSYNDKGTGFCWALSNVVDDGKFWQTNNSEAIGLRIYRNTVGARWELYLVEHEAMASDYYVLGTSASLQPFYLTVERTSETAAECRIYSDAIRATRLATISVDVPEGRRYRHVFAVNSYNSGSVNAVSFDVEDLLLH